MKPKSFSFLLLASICLTAASCSGDAGPESDIPAAAPVSGDPANTAYQYDTDEMRLAALINNHRTGLGLNSLGLINYISAASEGHNAYMIENEVVNHDGFSERLSQLTDALGAESVSENVAYNYQSAEGAFNAWLASPGHRAAIEGTASHFGLSVSSDAQGKKYYTAIFVYID